MCLYYDQESTKKRKQQTWFYKVYLKYNDGLISPVYSFYPIKPSKAGVIKSNRKNKAKGYPQGYAINKGIHVYNTLKVAREEKPWYRNSIILKVSAESKDLIGSSITESAFMKIKIQKKDLKLFKKKGK